MNIVLKTAGGRTIVRPDTTWEKNSGDFFPPDSVDNVTWTPVMFLRCAKPGRCIGRRFIPRYYDSLGFGMLLYPENMIDGSEEGFATASCLDHTSSLPIPLFPLQAAGDKANCFSVLKDGAQIFICRPGEASPAGTVGLPMMESVLEETSRMVYLRKGDFIAAELLRRSLLLSRGESPARVTATFCGSTVLDFEIRF